MYQSVKTSDTKHITETELQRGFRAYAMALLQYGLTKYSIWQNEEKESER